MIKGLLRKAEGECQKCRIYAAHQLALCRHTAFGKFDDDNNCSKARTYTYKHCLSICRRKGVLDLCNEVDFWEDRFESKVRSPKESLSGPPSIFNIDRPRNPFQSGILPSTIVRYQQESLGKINTAVCISSAVVLQRALGDLYTNYNMHGHAELAFRQLKQMDLLSMESCRHMTWRGFSFHKVIDSESSDTLIADALELQCKYSEAIGVIKSIPGVLKATRPHNTSGIWKEKLPKNYKWVDLVHPRARLLNWLVAKGQLDEAMQSGVAEALRDGYDPQNEICKRCVSANIALPTLTTLSKAIAKSGRLSDAIQLQRLSTALHEKFFVSGEDNDD